jgi:hypothetical protein
VSSELVYDASSSMISGIGTDLRHGESARMLFCTIPVGPEAEVLCKSKNFSLDSYLCNKRPFNGRPRDAQSLGEEGQQWEMIVERQVELVE